MSQGLNHFYRLIWNAAQHCWVVVGELGKSRGKKSKRISAFACMAIAMSAPLMSNLAVGAPLLSQIQQGQGSVDQQGAVTTINQQSQQLSIDWQSFNVQAHEQVNFVQPNRESIAINNILDNQGSQIHGQINANGQVWLVNPNGILFGEHAQVNVGGLVASSLSLASMDANSASFAKNSNSQSSAKVQNDGYIQTSNGGYIALISEQVRNTGTLVSEGGNISLAAGSAVNLKFAGEALLSLDIQQSTLDNLVDNQGLIQAEGGRVLMNAGAKDSLLASVVNNAGVIEARGVVEQNGEIILLSGMAAGTTYVDGTLDASAKVDAADGGFIETSGYKVKVADGTKITTQSKNANGIWLIDPKDFTIAASGGDMSGATISDALSTGEMVIESEDGSNGINGDIFVNDVISWSSDYDLTLSAHRNIEINASITATGANGKVHLKYGQGALASGNTASYRFNDASINLQAGLNFSTKLGSNGAVIAYTVITELGTQGSTTATDLQGISGDLAKNYVLGAEIVATATQSWNGGEGFDPLGDTTTAFSGTFDGLGHTIDGLFINRVTSGVGLFGDTGSAAIVRNIGMTNVDISGGGFTGGLIGFSEGKVSNSYVTGSVSGSGSTGGLIGESHSAVSNSYATASVVGNSFNTGGLIGRSEGKVSNSYATGNVSGSYYTGGLIGRSEGKVSNSYATGSVSADNLYTGGLLGSTSKNVSNSYATGVVTGSGNVGGLVGYTSGKISNSYWNKETTGQAASAGSGGSAGKTTEEMQSLDTFSAWGIADTSGAGKVWRIYDGNTAPLLSRFLTSYETAIESFTSEYDSSAKTFTLSALPDHIYSSNSTYTYTNAGDYSVDLYSNQQGFDLSDGLVAIKINPKAITLSATRVYDSTTALDLSLLSTGDLIGGDTLNYSGLASLAAKGVGTQVIVSAAIDLGNSNYVVASIGNTADISAKIITLSAVREYDGTADLALSLLTTDDLVGGDSLNYSGSASLAAKNVGSYSINTNTLGLGNSNYELASSGNTAQISAKAITLSAAREYDGSSALDLSLLNVAGLIASDNLGVSGSASLAAKDVGNQTIVTGLLAIANNNYVFASSGNTADISAKAITLSAAREYDGSSALDLSLLNVAGLIGGDNLGVTGSASLAAKDVGNQTIMTGSLDIGNSNYRLGGGHIATISPRRLYVVASAADKYFDNTTTATVNITTDSGLFLDDKVTITYSSAQFSEVFGYGLPVQITGITLSGLDATNYQLTTDTIITNASITSNIDVMSVVSALLETDPLFATKLKLGDESDAQDKLINSDALDN